jgi:hypothetical protein
MPPLARKSLRIAALTLGALILSALALAQTPNHPTPPCKPLTLTSEPTLSLVYNFTHPR